MDEVDSRDNYLQVIDSRSLDDNFPISSVESLTSYKSHLTVLQRDLTNSALNLVHQHLELYSQQSVKEEQDNRTIRFVVCTDSYTHYIVVFSCVELPTQL